MAVAQEGLRSSDATFNESELSDLLQGNVIEFYDGSKSTYSADGTYGYTYTDDGPVWSGKYRFQQDSKVCVDFDNGSARCDIFVKNEGRIILIIDDGTRFPVRNITVDDADSS